MKKVLFYLIPNLFFFLSFSLIWFFQLNIEKMIDVQNTFFSTLFKNLREKASLEAFYEPLEYFLLQAFLPAFLFFLPLSISFILLMKWREKINPKLFFISLLTFVPFWVFSDFSLVILFTSFSILISSYFIMNSSPAKFLKNYSTFSQAFNIICIAITFSIFLTLYINFPNYKSFVERSNREMLKSFFLSSEKLKEMQEREASRLFNRTADSLAMALRRAYQESGEEYKRVCGEMYSSLITALEEAKKEYVEVVKKENATEMYNEYIQQIPFLQELNNLFPLFLSLTVISFLHLVKIFHSALCALLLRKNLG